MVYLRNVYDYMVKHYREYTVRHRNDLKFPCYFEKHKRLFDYRLIIDRLNRGVNNNLSVYEYEGVEDITSHFFSSLGVDVDMLFVDSRYSNKGIDAVSCELRRLSSAFVKKLNDIPTADDLKDHYGIAFSKEISEPISSICLDFVDESYLNDVSKLSMLTSEELGRLFFKPDEGRLSIYNISSFLDALILPYLRHRD